MLIVVAGLPASGKTVLANALARRLDAQHFNTDVIRKIKIDFTYREKERHSVYNKLFEIAKLPLKQNKNVILDGTFFRREWRDAAKALAKEFGRGFALVELKCSEAVIKNHLAIREKHGKSESDADFSVYKIMKSQFEGISEEHLEIDSELPLEGQVEKVVAYIKTLK